MSALRELIAFLGVEVDDKKVDSANEKMKTFGDTALKIGETLGFAFGVHEITEFITKQIELGAEIAHTSEILGLGVGDLQAFQYAAANAGLGADEADLALKFLNKNLGEAAKGGGTAVQTFQRLGVHLRDSAGQIRPTQDVLADVADGIAKMKSPAEKTAAAMEVFGRQGARMIPLLNKGSMGINELYGEFEKLGGGIDEEFVEQAEKGEHELIKLRTAGRALESVIAREMLPAFEHVVSWITDGATAFREFAKHSYVVETALGTLAGAAIVLAAVWAILNIEVFIVIAALIGIYLAIDDVYTLMNGGESVIGDFIDEMFGVGASKEAVAELKKEWKDLAPAVTGVGTIFVDVLKIIAASIGSTLESVATLHAALIDIATNKGKNIPEIFKRSNERQDKFAALAAKGFTEAGSDFMDAVDPERQASRGRADGLKYPGGTNYPSREPGEMPFRMDQDGIFSQQDQRAMTMFQLQPAQAQLAVPQMSAPPASPNATPPNVHNETHIVVNNAKDARETAKQVSETMDDVNDHYLSTFAGAPGGGGH